MNADLEAIIADANRRMKKFEDRTAHKLDMFDRSVDRHQHLLGHRYAHLARNSDEDFDVRPISAPLWGVIMETNAGRIYKQDAPFDVVARCPRQCTCTTRHLTSPSWSSPSSSVSTSSMDRPIVEANTSIPSIEAKAIIEGHRWGVNKYLYDEDYVSNPPYGIIMKRPPPPPEVDFSDQYKPNTKLVSSYWRRKYKIPEDM